MRHGLNTDFVRPEMTRVGTAPPFFARAERFLAAEGAEDAENRVVVEILAACEEIERL